MQSDPRTISELFERKIRYVVPIFQRHYVWNEKDQWTLLWNDIRDKAIGRIIGRQSHPHFMGSVVLAHKRLPANTQSIPAFTVIDGQQRITTIQLILAALREVCRRYEQTPLMEDIEGCLINQYRSVNNDLERLKLWPTRFDQESFRSILTTTLADLIQSMASESKNQRKARIQQNNILGAYLFFEQSLRNFVEENLMSANNNKMPQDAGKILHHLYQALMNDFQIVEIQLLDKDDPQMIFETLNGRGTPLTSADLIRNYIFMRADKAGADMDALYDAYWEELETPFWSTKVKQGRMSEERLVFFFYNYLLYKNGDEVRFDKIFPSYKNWILNDQPFADITDELTNIKRASRVYEILTHASDDSILSRFARSLRRWDITAIYPLIMLIEIEGQSDDSECAKIYQDLDSYIIRRLVCDRTQKNYNKVFISILKKLREMGVNRSNLQTILLSYTSDINVWPSDGEFEKAWLERPVYNALGSNAVNGILNALEQQDRTRFSEDVTINSTLSVEHFMPFNWPDNWPINSRVITDTEWRDADTQWYLEEGDERFYGKIHHRDQLVQSFGNLTLIMQSLNSSFGNEGFDDKREKISKHSALALNRYFFNVEKWTEDEIVQRGKYLFKLALEAWPKPQTTMAQKEAA